MKPSQRISDAAKTVRGNISGGAPLGEIFRGVDLEGVLGASAAKALGKVMTAVVKDCGPAALRQRALGEGWQLYSDYVDAQHQLHTKVGGFKLLRRRGTPVWGDSSEPRLIPALTRACKMENSEPFE